MTLPDTEASHAPTAADSSALKDAVRRFENAWRQVPRPLIDDELPADGSLRSRIFSELVPLDLELRLKSGAPARVEEYLPRYPELAGDRDVLLELIAAEHHLRRRREPGLALDEYLSRFPDVRAELVDRTARAAGSASDALPG